MHIYLIFSAKLLTKIEISGRNVEGKNMKLLSKSITKFSDKRIKEEFYFFHH